MAEQLIVLITAGSKEEAEHIARTLVGERLAACVNILDKMNSIYFWEGKLQNDQECVMIAKTTAARVPALTVKVKALHSYDCPCIVSLPIQDGNPAFLEWVAEEVAAPRP